MAQRPKDRLTTSQNPNHSKTRWCLKRDRRYVPSPAPPPPAQTQPLSQTQTNRKNPDARTTPPTSLFLPMKLSNSSGPETRSRGALRKPRRQTARRASLEPETLTLCFADAKQERPKALHPHLSVGRSMLRKVPETAAAGRSVKRATSSVVADIEGSRSGCQRNFTKKFSAGDFCWRFAPLHMHPHACRADAR